MMVAGDPALAQRVDTTQAPNAVGAGIAKSLAEQARAGDAFTPGSSIFLIQRDPARSIRRGRQLFQRKFSVRQGLGPLTADDVGKIASEGSMDAGGGPGGGEPDDR